MQTAMDALTAFLKRRKWLIVGAWVALLVAALPSAMRQTEHLTSGGFSSPGSGSAAVNRALADFENVQSDSLALVVARRDGARDSDIRAAIDHADRVAVRLPHVELSDRAKAAANADVGRSPIAVAVFDVSGDLDETADLATDLRAEVGAGEGPKDGVETYLVGQQALWAGMQDLSKEDLAAAEATGFPIVADPARGVRLARGGGSAAGARRGERPDHRRGHLLPLPGDGHVGLRDQRGVDDRYRRGSRLLAVHPGALPRGDPRGRRPRHGTPDRPAHLWARRPLLGRHRDGVPGRALSRQLHDDQVDGARGDRRGGRIDPGGGHLPAGHDEALRAPRLHARAPQLDARSRGGFATTARPERSRS